MNVATSGGMQTLVRVGLATVAVAGVAAAAAYVIGRRGRGQSHHLLKPIHVVRSVTINRSPEVVYEYWRDLENLPRFMAHLDSVTEEDDKTSLWRAKGPAGLTIEWRSVITLEQDNERLVWRSLPGASVPNRGAVCFKHAPGGRGTELIVELKYEPPGGALGSAVAKLFGEEPGLQVISDLRRLKQVLETGGVVHSDSSIHRGLHAARPAAQDEPTTVLGRNAGS